MNECLYAHELETRLLIKELENAGAGVKKLYNDQQALSKHCKDWCFRAHSIISRSKKGQMKCSRKLHKQYQTLNCGTIYPGVFL
jgi:hypothetical protein